MKPRIHIPLLIALGAVLFIINLGAYDLWPPDEPRFAQVAREMVQSGDYLAPHINGHPYTEKPPLLFWAQAALSIPFGDVTEWPARLPSAIAGLITVLLTYLLARRLYGTRVAFWAGLILVTTQRFWWQSRFGQIDMLLTACLTGALLLFWLWHTGHRPALLVGFYLCVAAGALAKGPPAVVFPLLMAITFYWGRGEERRRLHLGWGLLLVAVVVCLWLVPARFSIASETSADAGANMASNLYRQTVGRFFLGVAHAKPPWFYIEKLPLDLLPWGLFLPWVLHWVWKRRREGPEMRFLLSWILPALVFFSACIGKRAIYLLPLYPAFAILLSRAILDLMDGKHARWRRLITGLWGAGLLLVAAAPAAIRFTDYEVEWNPALYLFFLCALVCGLYMLFMAWRSAGRDLARQMVVQVGLLAVLSTFAIFPALDQHKSSREFCEPLRALSLAGTEYDLFSLGFSREEYVYYSDHFHEAVLCDMLDMESMKELGLIQQGRRQSAMQRAIQKAVKAVPVKDVSAVSDAEIQALQAAIMEKLRVPEGQTDYHEEYEAAVREILDGLFGRMRGDKAALIMAQEEDWRWVLAFHPDARELRVVEDRFVGRRHVLLLANEPAARAMESPDAPAAR